MSFYQPGVAVRVPAHVSAPLLRSRRRTRKPDDGATIGGADKCFEKTRKPRVGRTDTKAINVLRKKKRVFDGRREVQRGEEHSPRRAAAPKTIGGRSCDKVLSQDKVSEQKGVLLNFAYVLVDRLEMLCLDVGLSVDGVLLFR